MVLNQDKAVYNSCYGGGGFHLIAFAINRNWSLVQRITLANALLDLATQCIHGLHKQQPLRSTLKQYGEQAQDKVAKSPHTQLVQTTRNAHKWAQLP